MSALVLSRPDYCNSLLSVCPQYLSNELQKVQNNAARLVLRVSKTDHICPHLAFLHWLPIDSRIQYKFASLCHNSLNSTVSVYLTELLTVYKPTRQLRSSSDISILCPGSGCCMLPIDSRIQYKFASLCHNSLSLCVHALAWSEIFFMLHRLSGIMPCKMRSSDIFTSFKSSFKSHLFKLSYWLCLCMCGGGGVHMRLF